MPPTYEYRCPRGHEWDVVKRIADIDEVERCASCDFMGERQVTLPSGTIGASDWNSQTFNPALGCFTKSDRHARQIAKAKGYEEVGNEKPEVIHKHFDDQKTREREQRWADADREKLYGD